MGLSLSRQRIDGHDMRVLSRVDGSMHSGYLTHEHARAALEAIDRADERLLASMQADREAAEAERSAHARVTARASSTRGLHDVLFGVRDTHAPFHP